MAIKRPFNSMVRRLLAIVLGCLVLGVIALTILGGREGPTMKGIGERRMTRSRDGTGIAFTRLGSGPAVILVDGAFCYRENGPAPDLAPLLSQQFTVFAYDRRGRGESGDTAPYAIDREVEDLQALVSEAGGSAFVVGVSSGAGLALQAAASGLTISKLALYEPPYVDSGGRSPTAEYARRRLEQLVSAGDRRAAVKYFMADVVGVPRAFVLVMPWLMRSAWKKNELVAHTLSYDLTILSDRSVLDDRRTAIVVPTLVIGGEKSPPELRNAVSAVASALPHARSRFLEGQNHFLSAETVAPVLREFFSAN